MIVRLAALLAALGLTACVAVPELFGTTPDTDRAATPAPAPTLPAAVSAPNRPLPPATLSGQYDQGGYIRGTVPFGSIAATLNGQPLTFDAADGAFFAGLDRDAPGEAVLQFTARDGQTRTHTLAIAPRDWDIERVNIARRPAGSDEAWWAMREPEWLAIKAAREKDTGAQGWRQAFVWPLTGRVSGRFGRQRIYRGEPGSYHSGLDIAAPSGTPFVAPADGVVVLARTGFSIEGGIVIVDHGAGLNSAFIHLSRLDVAEGDRVTQGQQLGAVGSTGRSTGPHLHWSLMWQDARLDPLLFLPPMP